jgi:hypothetical protein
LAWYQRTYSNLNKLGKKVFNLKYLMFILIIFFVNYFYNRTTIECFSLYKSQYLNHYLINNKVVYTYGNISYITASDIINNILLNSTHHYDFNILKFSDLYRTKLPRNHPFSHPHLNILNFNDQLNNILVNMQMSSRNFNNCSYLSKKNILGDDDDQ